jgi:hypothetical protein
MELKYNDYLMKFSDGGLEVFKDNKLLYFNKRPMFAMVKTYYAVSEFYDKAYDEIILSDDKVIGKGVLKTPSGSEFAFYDIYEALSTGFKVSRNVKVLKAADDLGFSTKISFTMAESDNTHDYNYFAPGVWYRQNEYAPDFVFGKDLDCEYFWRMETFYAMPLFAMQNIASGESAALSRWASDVTMRSHDIFINSENNNDPKFTIGAIGMSKPKTKTVNYMYYGFAVRRPFDAKVDGLSIDYVYPGCNGQLPGRNMFGGLDYKEKVKTFHRIYHPVQVGFEQNYAVAFNLGQYESFQPMMRSMWRVTYERLRDKLFEVDNEMHFHNCMKIFMKYARKYGDAYGLPFACQLPDMDVTCVSFQFGFVGQQPGIGYQLLRYGDKENIPEAFDKGMKIIDFWVSKSMTESGLPYMCYNPCIEEFEPYPFYIRMLADGVEAILDAWRYMHKKGEEKPSWLEFCRKIAEWLINIQNEDGSFYRAYNLDNSVRMDSKANTPSIIRFLVQFYLVTGDERYKAAAIRAGEWSYENSYKNLEYRGGTCDCNDIQDKEAGIYAMFGFLALYDLTQNQKWLEAAIGAADYTETWTYAWTFPVTTLYLKHPFNKNSISGQSLITVCGGADVYMAACSYTYYRLYLITGDEHYLDFAEFIHKNTRQSNDVDGSFGYAMPGIGNECSNFTTQILETQYHWLPWATFVETEPSSRLYDTFGCYEIEDAQKLSPEERSRRNRIYDNYL